MRILAAVAFAAMLSACTSVRMVQRDGCWIKRTEKVFGRVREEIGPCTRAQPQWVSDQLTRLTQECVAQADYRWQARALEAWSKEKTYPAQPPQEEILRTCMQEARVGLVTENEELKRRVADLATDREALQQASEQDRTHLRSSHEQLAKYLGEAAIKPPAPAVATATATSNSDGKATNESGATLATESSSGSGSSGVPTVPVTVVPAPASAPACAAPPTESRPPESRPAKLAQARRPKVVQAVRAAAPEATAAPCEIPADDPPKADEPRP